MEKWWLVIFVNIEYNSSHFITFLIQKCINFIRKIHKFKENLLQHIKATSSFFVFENIYWFTLNTKKKHSDIPSIEQISKHSFTIYWMNTWLNMHFFLFFFFKFNLTCFSSMKRTKITIKCECHALNI